MGATWNPAQDMPNLTGKIALVTGASTGIGFQIVRRLAQRGAKVFATTRSEEKAEKARDALKTRHPDIPAGAIEWLPLDLTNLQRISEVSEEIRSKADRLDVLVHNAATATPVHQLVDGRWEKHMAVSVVGPFLLTNRLLPLLQKTAKMPGADVRIVTCSSNAPQVFLPKDYPLRFDSPSALAASVSTYPWHWRFLGRFVFASDMILYSVAKAGAEVFASQLQKTLDQSHLPILSLVVHPGPTATERLLEVNGTFIRAVARLAFQSAEQAASLHLFAATAERVRQQPEQFKNALLVPGGQTMKLHPVTSDGKQAGGLWDTVDGQLNQYLKADGLAPLQGW